MPDQRKYRDVIISDTAKENYEKILQETKENFGNSIALKLIVRFKRFINIIGYQPYLFGYYLRSKNIRKFIFTKSHLVLYKPKRKEVEIIAIVYQKQKRNTIRRKI
jgi:plasmid stabilization system protein ParE